MSRLLILIFITASLPASFADHPAAFDTWAKHARVAGAAVWPDMTDEEISEILTEFVQQNVTTIEADSNLSNYLTDAQFDQELSLMRRFASAGHRAGLRVVWYYPGLEVVTPNGRNLPSTMFKDHPDWVQMGIDGTPNVFYGGGGQVFWVDKKDESAWMSPSVPEYREFFFARVREIVATGIDGLWIDVPIYADFGPTEWSDFNPQAIARFEADTGHTIPKKEDWNDEDWRAWIDWRHQELRRFLVDLTAIARAEDADFPVIVETLPTDYNAGTLFGLDGGALKSVEGLTNVWEVDTMSNNVGMRRAKEDDWISFISAYKYARAATGTKPSWVFTYGLEEEDAELVMAEALACGNNPYELMVPEMTTTVGEKYRSRMFNWAQTYSPYLYDSQSAADIAVFYSSASRDFVDKYEGQGMFVTWQSEGDSLWWADDALDSAYARQYLAEFRGFIKLLVHNHYPFDTLVNPLHWSELAKYNTLILPNIEALTDAEADSIRQYVQNGGHVIVTGPNPTGLDDIGSLRPDYALSDVLGFSKTEPLPDRYSQIFGRGTVQYFSDLLGKQYFVDSSPQALRTLKQAIDNTSPLTISTNADRRVHFELRELGDEIALQLVNFVGIDGSFSVVHTSFSVSLDIPFGKKVTAVNLSSPDLHNTPAETPLDFKISNQQVHFDITDLQQYGMVIVSFDGATRATNNNTPIAADDELAVEMNDSIQFDQGILLANDGDLDNEVLSVTEIDGSNTIGTLDLLSPGTYRYTPPAGFEGVDTHSYRITDGHGGIDSGLVRFVVSAPTKLYYPHSINHIDGEHDYGTLAGFHAIDDDTYDARSAAGTDREVVEWIASTTIEETDSQISQITVSYLGNFSHTSIAQELSIYNYRTNAWEVIDTSVIGNEDDVPVIKLLDRNVADYVSDRRELQFRFKGTRTLNRFLNWINQYFRVNWANQFFSWTDHLSWAVR